MDRLPAPAGGEGVGRVPSGPRPPSYSIRIGEGEPDIGRGPLHSDEPGDSACTHHPPIK